MRTFIYLSQFRLNIKYRSNKKHVISNALSRLFFDNESTTLNRNNLNNVLDLNNYFCNVLNSSNDSNCYVFQKSFINIFEKFRKQIIDDYA